MRTLLLSSLLLALSFADVAAQDLSRPGAGGPPTEVRVLVYLVDLYSIASSDETFFADVILQAQWMDPRLQGKATGVAGISADEVWTPRLQLVNQLGITPSLPRIVEVNDAGRVTFLQRWVGRFSQPMYLQDFPLDRQQFRITVVSLGHPPSEISIVPMVDAARSARTDKLAIPDWDVGPATLVVRAHEPTPGQTLAGVELQWEARRHVAYYAVQVILPLVLIVLMSGTAFYIAPSVLASRVSVAMTAMLTVIAYRFSLGASVPRLTYLTRFDYFMLASTLLVFLNLLAVIAGAYLDRIGRGGAVHTLDRWTRWLFPVVFAVVFVASWWG